MDDSVHECRLLQKGIIGMPIVAGGDVPENSPHDREVREMRRRQQNRFAYGSTALVRVNPKENHGNDIIPVIVDRSTARL